jgi:ribose transport system substrate-binding protein
MARHRIVRSSVIGATLAGLLILIPYLQQYRAEAKRQLTIAGVVAVTSDPYFITMHCGAVAAARRFGAKVTWQGPVGASVPAEVTALESAAVLNPSGVMLSPFSDTAFLQPVQALMKRGIPVTLADGPLAKPVALRAYYTSVTGVGVTLANKVGVLIHGHGSIAVIASTAGDPVEGARYAGFQKALAKKFPQAKVLPAQYANDDSSKAATIVSGLLIAHPDLAAVYTTDGPAGQGVASALRAAHKTGIVKLVSFDATPLEVRGLRNGEFQGLMSQTPYLEGFMAVTALLQYLTAHSSSTKPVKPAQPNYVPTQVRFITKADLSNPNAQKFLYRASC